MVDDNNDDNDGRRSMGEYERRIEVIVKMPKQWGWDGALSGEGGQGSGWGVSG